MGEGDRLTWTTRVRRAARRPRRTAVAKSSRRVSRLGAGSTKEIRSETVRPTTGCDPGGGALRRSVARRGSASAAGIRGSWRDDGCWAGRCACLWSRLSFSRCVHRRLGRQSGHRPQPSGLRSPPTRTGTTIARVGDRIRPRSESTLDCPPVGGRLSEGRGQGRAPSKPTPMTSYDGATPPTRRCLLSQGSCGSAPGLLACPLAVLRPGRGKRLRRPVRREHREGTPIRRTVMHSCG